MVDTVIVGTGPYGLSIAAHLRHHGIPFRIFGRPMDSWSSHMPKGMFLKSDGFASNLYDANSDFTLQRFCAEHNLQYADLGTPVSLQTFVDYGLAFKNKLVPQVEEKFITSINRSSGGYRVEVEDGEVFEAKRVILAVGITHCAHLPAMLADLPPELLTHSSEHSDLSRFRGRSVVILGAGSSAIDLAALLHEIGADVQLVARRTALKFHERMRTDKPRSLWQQMRHPVSGLGPGLQTRFYADAPNLFWYLPENLRLKTVRTTLGPSGGWFIKDKIVGRVPLLLGATLKRAEVGGHRVRLTLTSEDFVEKVLSPDHVIAATGYKVDIDRLTFLAPEIRQSIQSVESTPVLSSNFESSVPGLYFVGLAAANSFGPVMRFAFGAGFAARHLSRAISKVASRGRAIVATPEVSRISDKQTEQPVQRLSPVLSEKAD
jgi:Pyridine nucleotide-disulphide oxidoreductase